MRLHPILSAALSPVSLIYRTGLLFRNWGYQSGLLRKKRLPAPVISIGNLSLGGTGKTPCAIYLAARARERGYSPAILTRGYGGQARGAVIVSDGVNLRLGPDMAGDEAYLMGKRTAGVPVIKSPDRYAGGLLAIESFNSNLFILDDGFQHIRVERDVDIVLISASMELPCERLFPAGNLREPLSALGRAHEIVLTKAGHGEEVRRKTEIGRLGIGGRVSFMTYEPAVLVDSAGNTWGLEMLVNRRVFAFSGIADPDHFERSLVVAGADVVESVRFGDHHSYVPGELEAIRKIAAEIDAEMIITTEKDMVKLEGVTSDGILALRARVSLEDAALERIFHSVSGCLNG